MVCSMGFFAPGFCDPGDEDDELSDFEDDVEDDLLGDYEAD